MNTLYINPYPQHYLDTILIIVPSKPKYELLEKFSLVDFYTKEFIAIKYIVSKETLRLKDITNAQSYLAKNCDKNLFHAIIKDQYKKANDKGEITTFINEESFMDVLVMTSKGNIRKLYNPQEYLTADIKKSLLSNKKTISQTYQYQNKPC